MFNMLEREVEARVCKYAKALGWYPRKQEGRNLRGKTDRYFFRPWNEVIFIEFKAPGKTPTVLQDKEIALLKSCGVPTFVIDTPAKGFALFDELERQHLHWNEENNYG